MEKKQGQSGGVGSVAYILFLKLQRNGKSNAQQTEYITCSCRDLKKGGWKLMLFNNQLHQLGASSSHLSIHLIAVFYFLGFLWELS